MKNEAHARIKINQLLKEAGWRFFDNEKGKANILLEDHVKITQNDIDTWGNDYQKTTHGSLDFLLEDSNGVNDGYLINPRVLDARPEVITQLLSDEGYAVVIPTEEGEETETIISHHFKKRFFSEKTNSIFCQTFLENVLGDPITGEIGKTIIFAVSQNHARKITEMLNEFTDQLFPGKYNSDFAVQVTSQMDDAQQMTIIFTNNTLNGKTIWLEGYKSCKTRVCVTVGMMTTGYDDYRV